MFGSCSLLPRDFTAMPVKSLPAAFPSGLHTLQSLKISVGLRGYHCHIFQALSRLCDAKGCSLPLPRGDDHLSCLCHVACWVGDTYDPESYGTCSSLVIQLPIPRLRMLGVRRWVGCMLDILCCNGPGWLPGWKPWSCPVWILGSRI